MVLGLQGYLVLNTYGAETSLGMLVALSLLRELGPVVTALLFAGRAGSALTAEIGLMKATGPEARRDHPAQRVNRHHLHAGELFSGLHQADFGGQRRPCPSGEQQRGHNKSA